MLLDGLQETIQPEAPLASEAVKPLSVSKPEWVGKWKYKKGNGLAMAAAVPRFPGDRAANGCSMPVDLMEKGVYSSYTLYFVRSADP